EFQKRSQPHRAAARHDRIAEYGDDDRAGARGFALELVDDASKRLWHHRRIPRFHLLRQWGTGAALISNASSSPSPRKRGEVSARQLPIRIGINEAAPAAA